MVSRGRKKKHSANLRHILAKVFARLVQFPACTSAIVRTSRRYHDSHQQLTTGGKDVFITIIPAPLDDLAGMRFVFLHCCIGQHPHVVMNVKVEERARLASRLIDDKVVEAVVMRDDEVLLGQADDDGWHM